MQKSRHSLLMAAAAMAAMAQAGTALAQTSPPGVSRGIFPRPARPTYIRPARRSANPEIQAWNAAVDAKKAARKAKQR